MVGLRPQAFCVQACVLHTVAGGTAALPHLPRPWACSFHGRQAQASHPPSTRRHPSCTSFCTLSLSPRSWLDATGSQRPGLGPRQPHTHTPAGLPSLFCHQDIGRSTVDAPCLMPCFCVCRAVLDGLQDPCSLARCGVNCIIDNDILPRSVRRPAPRSRGRGTEVHLLCTRAPY